mmetsp:Transcript_22860/g.68530  ORF Transcript_22860/g.68530 Transcript_22860/m.68530 type:complete len:669 (-) Transcript_22860:92-2098(-)
MPPQCTILRRALTALVLCAVHTKAFRSPAPRLGGRIKNRAATQWDARRAGSARTDLTVAKVLAGPASEEEVAHAVEALLQPGGADSPLETLFDMDKPLLQEDEADTTIEAVLQGSADAPYDLADAAAEVEETEELIEFTEFAEMELPCLEREILVDGEDLLREVDQDSALWKTLDDLPVLSNPILAAVDPEAAVAEDEDAITRRKVRARALPLFVVWLAAPTLSLIDTAVVGRFARGPAAAAALAPAVSFSDSLAYLMSFLAIVTTSRVAAGVAHHDGRGARLAAREGLVLSLVVGCAMAAVGEFGGAAATLKRVYVTRSTAAVLAPATTYCRIRGIALPLQLAWQTAQAASIARGDSASPLRACAYAAIINVIVDVILVAGLGWGVAGAAAATALATAVGCAAQLRSLARLERTERVAEAVGVEDIEAIPEDPRPTIGGLGRLFVEALPVFLTILSKTVVGVVLVAAVASASLAELAAHQIATGLFLLLSPFADALAAASQSLAPRALRRAKQRPAKVLGTVLMETLFASALGAAMTFSVARFGASLFTSSPEVAAACASLAPAVAASLGVYVTNTAFEGTLFALGHARPIGLLMPFNALLVALALLGKGVRGSPFALQRSWWVFVAYQIFRIPQLAWIARRREEPVAPLGAPDEEEVNSLPVPALA